MIWAHEIEAQAKARGYVELSDLINYYTWAADEDEDLTDFIADCEERSCAYYQF